MVGMVNLGDKVGRVFISSVHPIAQGWVVKQFVGEVLQALFAPNKKMLLLSFSFSCLTLIP